MLYVIISNQQYSSQLFDVNRNNDMLYVVFLTNVIPANFLILTGTTMCYT